MLTGSFNPSEGVHEVDNAPHVKPEEDFGALNIVPARKQESDGKPKEYDPLDYYRAYYSTSMWVSVLDGNQSEKHARAVRKIWEKQDLGDTQKMARDEIDRQMSVGQPCLRLGQIVRVGSRLPNAPSHHEGRKLALVPNPGECIETQALLCEENRIIVEAIQKRMKKFVPLGAYIPYITIAWFKNGVEESEVAKIAKKTQELAAENPVNVALERQISFRDRLVR